MFRQENTDEFSKHGRTCVVPLGQGIVARAAPRGVAATPTVLAMLWTVKMLSHSANKEFARSVAPAMTS